ncbi:5961_t:CDS:2, partial [Gigaspora rosea]
EIGGEVVMSIFVEVDPSFAEPIGCSGYGSCGSEVGTAARSVEQVIVSVQDSMAAEAALVIVVHLVDRNSSLKLAISVVQKVLIKQ